MDMSRQFFTKDMVIRIIGDDGKELFPLIEKNDLEGNFDYSATVYLRLPGKMTLKEETKYGFVPTSY